AAWGIFLPLAAILSTHTHLGVTGAWIGATVYIYLLGAALFWRFVSGRWQKIDIFAPLPTESAGTEELDENKVIEISNEE
ncbi:MAG TPA: hypothetical protein VM223_07730, partial [Planctomycetota bacterium]|nr:hypothetical protein [Planctomycetota bacterium]